MTLRIKYLFTLTIVVMIVLVACQNYNQHKQKGFNKNNYQALTLLQNNCFSCHNPDLNIQNRIAPPMFKIREHYLSDKISKDDFIKNIIHFVNDPSEKNSIMPGAVRNFGLMPKQQFNQKDLNIMAAYLFDNDVSTDKWAKDWETFKKQPKKENKDLSDLELGQNIANQTKSQLGKNLLKAIQKYGTAGAVDFCNTRAIPITDSMSSLEHVKITRISDKNRNPLNKANRLEIEIINNFKSKLESTQPLEPRLVDGQNIVTGYYPILTGKMCLQCHGIKNEDINPETSSILKKLYPNDKAIGYKENDLRGLFKIEMNKNKK